MTHDASTDSPLVERAQPETLRLRAAAPVLTVNDLATSVAWYRDVMAFMVAEEWRHDDGVLMGVTLRAGTVEVNLAQDDFAKGRDRSKGVGFRILLETAQDVDALADRITARGGTLDQPPTTQPWGARVFAVTDPDGFKLSIYNRPEAG